MSSIAVLDDPFPLAAQSTIVRAGGIVRDPTLGQVPPDGALVESVCSRSASKAIFAFSAASIFRLGFFIIRSVYHDRAGRSPIKPPVPKSGSMCDHQDPPLVLRIQPLLQLGERLDAKRENLLSARLILGFEVAGIVGIEFLQPELVAVGDAIRSTKLPTSLDPLRQAQSFEGHRASSLSSVWLSRSGTVLA